MSIVSGMRGMMGMMRIVCICIMGIMGYGSEQSLQREYPLSRGIFPPTAKVILK